MTPWLRKPTDAGQRPDLLEEEEEERRERKKLEKERKRNVCLITVNLFDEIFLCYLTK